MSLRLYAKFRESLGSDRVEMSLDEGATIIEALEKLFRGPPPTGVMVALNDRLVNDLNIELHDGDAIDVMPPASGG